MCGLTKAEVPALPCELRTVRLSEAGPETGFGEPARNWRHGVEQTRGYPSAGPTTLRSWRSLGTSLPAAGRGPCPLESTWSYEVVVGAVGGHRDLPADGEALPGGGQHAPWCSGEEVGVSAAGGVPRRSRHDVLAHRRSPSPVVPIADSGAPPSAGST